MRSPTLLLKMWHYDSTCIILLWLLAPMCSGRSNDMPKWAKIRIYDVRTQHLENWRRRIDTWSNGIFDNQHIEISYINLLWDFFVHLFSFFLTSPCSQDVLWWENVDTGFMNSVIEDVNEICQFLDDYLECDLSWFERKVINSLASFAVWPISC